MKKIFKYIILLSVLIISCQPDDNFNGNEAYSHLKEVGNSAHDILANDIFTNIFVEILYVEGLKPTDKVISNFKDFILERTFKNTVTIETRLIDIPLKSSYTTNEIRSIEDANRTKFSSENELAIFVIFINGESSKNEDDSVILGTSYRNTSFVIFKETLQSFSNNFFGTKKVVLESTVICHEFSHLLGLVNLGTPMVEDHQDSENGAHCITESCLLYHKIERMNTAVNFFNQDQIPELDAFCLQDLRANGGR